MASIKQITEILENSTQIRGSELEKVLEEIYVCDIDEDQRYPSNVLQYIPVLFIRIINKDPSKVKIFTQDNILFSLCNLISYYSGEFKTALHISSLIHKMGLLFVMYKKNNGKQSEMIRLSILASCLKVLTENKDILQSFKARNIDDTLWGLVNLGCAQEALMTSGIRDLFLDLVHQEAYTLQSRNISSILWALHKLYYSWRDLSAYVVNGVNTTHLLLVLIHENAHRFNNQDISSILHSLSLYRLTWKDLSGFELHNKTLQQKLLSSVCQNIDMLNIKDITCILSALVNFRLDWQDTLSKVRVDGMSLTEGLLKSAYQASKADMSKRVDVVGMLSDLAKLGCDWSVIKHYGQEEGMSFGQLVMIRLYQHVDRMSQDDAIKALWAFLVFSNRANESIENTFDKMTLEMLVSKINSFDHFSENNKLNLYYILRVVNLAFSEKTIDMIHTVNLNTQEPTFKFHPRIHQLIDQKKTADVSYI